MENEKKRGNPAWEKGVSGNPHGRPIGSKNVASGRMKQAFADLIEGNLDNLNTWLIQTAAEDPKGALDIILKLSERFIPKLSQTQLTDGDGENLFKNVTFQFGPSIDDESQRELGTEEVE